MDSGCQCCQWKRREGAVEVDGIQGSSGVHAGGQEERRGAHGVKRTAKGDFEERGLGRGLGTLLPAMAVGANQLCVYPGGAH